MLALYDWWNTPNPQAELSKFAANLQQGIPRFEDSLTTAFKQVDTVLYEQLLTVNYLYQSTLNDLTARYYFTNQPLTGAIDPYGLVFLSKSIGSPFNYVNWDEETHVKIDRFINNHTAFFKGPFGGFQFENGEGYTNLTFIKIVAHDQFKWESSMTVEMIAEKIKLFQDAVHLAWKEFNAIFSKNALPPVYKEMKASKKKQQLAQNLSMETSQVYQKMEAFNKLFNLIVNDPTTYSFSLTDNTVRFTVTYVAQSKDFQFSAPVNNHVPFQVTKKYQEEQRAFCVNNSKMIKKGTLQLKQDPLTLNFFYEASRLFPVADRNNFNNEVIAFVNDELEVASKVF